MKKKLPRAINRQSAGTSDEDVAVVAPTNTVQTAKNVPIMPHETHAPKPTNVSDDSRRAHAMKLINRFSFASGAAGLIPMPFLDLAVVGGMQIDMIRRIARIYGVPFSETRGKALLASLAGAVIPSSSGIGAASMVKGVPIIGTAVGAFAMPTLFTGATYAIGVAFMQHFATGGTLQDFNPRTVAVSS